MEMIVSVGNVRTHNMRLIYDSFDTERAMETPLVPCSMEWGRKNTLRLTFSGLVGIAGSPIKVALRREDDGKAYLRSV